MTYPPPALPVFPAGYGPLPADFDSWVQATLGFCTNGIVFRASQHAQQSYTAAGGYTVVQYDHITEDPFGGWDGVNFRWVAPYTGWYEVTVFNSVATASVVLQTGFMITGVNRYLSSEHQLNGSFLGGGAAVATAALTGGLDYIQGLCSVSGNASSDVSSIGRYPRMEITFVSQ